LHIFVHFVFLLLWLYEKKGVNGLGKEKDKGRSFNFGPFTFLSTLGGGGGCGKNENILLK
jgi:hypothetical protein